MACAVYGIDAEAARLQALVMRLSWQWRCAGNETDADYDFYANINAIAAEEDV